MKNKKFFYKKLKKEKIKPKKIKPKKIEKIKRETKWEIDVMFVIRNVTNI